MRSNIPSFRLPAAVLDEEIAMIVDMGVDVRYGTPVAEHEGAARARASTPCSSAAGAPRGKNLEIPGR